MEELKPYIFEFEKDCTMKPKVYPSDCEVGKNNRQHIVVITYNECIFFAKDGFRKALTQKGDTFSRAKD